MGAALRPFSVDQPRTDSVPFDELERTKQFKIWNSPISKADEQPAKGGAGGHYGSVPPLV